MLEAAKIYTDSRLRYEDNNNNKKISYRQQIAHQHSCYKIFG